MLAAYVLTITDGQDMQKQNRLRPIAITSGGCYGADRATSGTCLTAPARGFYGYTNIIE